jgi:hypothetical protein
MVNLPSHYSNNSMSWLSAVNVLHVHTCTTTQIGYWLLTLAAKHLSTQVTQWHKNYMTSNYLSNALTRPSNFLLFRQLTRTWVLLLTDCVKTDKGPVLNSSCSFCASSSCVISLLGFCTDLWKEQKKMQVSRMPSSSQHSLHFMFSTRLYKL